MAPILLILFFYGMCASTLAGRPRPDTSKLPPIGSDPLSLPPHHRPTHKPIVGPPIGSDPLSLPPQHRPGSTRQERSGNPSPSRKYGPGGIRRFPTERPDNDLKIVGPGGIRQDFQKVGPGGIRRERDIRRDYQIVGPGGIQRPSAGQRVRPGGEQRHQNRDSSEEHVGPFVGGVY